MNKTKIKKHTINLLRIVIGLGLAAVLIFITLKQTDTNLWEQLSKAAVPLLGLALFFYGIVLLVGAYRWQTLLRAQNIHISFKNVCRLQIIGFFFNLVVPGAVGGDVVKMGFAVRRAPEQKTETVFSILVDRILGLLGLFIVAAISVLAAFDKISALGGEYHIVETGAYIVAFCSVAGVAVFLALEFHHRLLHHKWVAPILNNLKRKLPHNITATAKRIITALNNYRQSRRTLAWALLMSIFVHTFLALALFAVGQSLHEDRLNAREYFVTAQVSNAIASVPLTPGGLGVRDKGTQEFFLAFGMKPAKSGAIPVTLTLVILAWALFGAIIFAFSPVPHKVPNVLKMAEEEKKGLTP